MNKISKLINSRIYISIELIIIGIIIPSLILINRLADDIILILWFITLYAGIIYFKNNKYHKIKNTLNFGAFSKDNLKVIIYRWFVLSILIFLITYFFYFDKLFMIQKTNPYLLIIIFIFYPIFSALPQEFIFCTFFFNRYKNLIPQKYIIISSATLFMFAHILFINFIAPFLSIFGGLIFASTYKKTNSLALVSLEHALYGNTLFFVGLGYYFWGGSVN
tara:strand:- start:15460 stop:16119 length:660 start_codon:yes stop_codon:yes gene_type:complete